MSNSDAEQMRLQKLIANAGYASRREAERLIAAERVTVNGDVAILGTKASRNDKIRIDGQLLKTKKHTRDQHQTIGLHKPIGVICTRSDPQGRPTVFDLLPKLNQGRWIQVGRLDINTSGLILFTTDGELAHRLMHPSYEVEREYAVRVLGEPNKKTIQNLLTGIELEDGMAKFQSIEKQNHRNIPQDKANHWFHVILKEGRKREVRRLWEAAGHPVNRLIRIRYANIRMHREIRPKEILSLSSDQLSGLKNSVKL